MIRPELIGALRKASPRIHCITNYVTAGDCANLLLAAGALPVMADDPGEAAEITSGADALALNLGTLCPERVEAMCISGRQANRMGIPVVLDPVGVGASQMRRSAAARLLQEVRITAIRCNRSELYALADDAAMEGVDAKPENSTDSLTDTLQTAKALARRLKIVVAVTGKDDLVTDGTQSAIIRNGHPLMRYVTGTGCMLSAYTAAFLAVCREEPFAAVCTAVCAMGVCGEIAAKALSPEQGSGTYRIALTDAVYRLNGETLQSMGIIALLP